MWCKTFLAFNRRRQQVQMRHIGVHAQHDCPAQHACPCPLRQNRSGRTMSSEKQNVALASLLASAFLAATKLVAALATGSLGILSEAIHSILDFGATAVTWFAVRVSDRPPDEEHHFGHAKVESVAALVETALLFLTTGWIVFEAVRRLAGDEVHVEVTWWAIAIIAGSIVIDFNRSRALSRTAKKTSSEALEADALHFSSDMWSSAVVLAGLGAAWAGFSWADPVAALAVAFFVSLAGWRLGQRTLATLLDAAPEGTSEVIRHIAEDAHGVLAVRRLRVRPAGATLFVDAHVTVARTLAFDTVATINQGFVAAVRRRFPSADVTVTAIPVELDDETIADKVMLIATRRGLAIHHLTVQHVGERLSVSFDLEVDGHLPLAAAHDIATALEQGIEGELGSGVEVESHIEPLQTDTVSGKDASAALTGEIAALLAADAEPDAILTGIHNVRVRDTAEGLYVTFHCRVPGRETVRRVHEAVDALEVRLKREVTGVHRVIAHAEPLELREP
jgi:cation diffusion facilitator family transporter